MTDADNGPLRIDRAVINRRIERLDVSADVKAVLASLIDTSVQVGGKLIDLGARVVAFVFDLAKAYPGVAFGTLVALVLSYLISSIPGVGPVLSPFLTPLLLIIGISLGALDDFMNGAMRARLANLETHVRAAGVV